MLTGLERPSEGSATVAGFDIDTQIRLAHKMIGVCPQFDKIWPDLSQVNKQSFLDQSSARTCFCAYKSLLVLTVCGST